MKLALRRSGVFARDRDDGAGPTAAFAAIIDGHLLWIAVPVQAGRLALRDVESNEIITLTAEEVLDQPAFLGARLDLADLDGEEARYDVVLVPPGNQDPVEVRTPPIERPPVRTSVDGRTQHALVRTAHETLLVRTTLLPAAAGLLSVRKLVDAVELTLIDAGPELAILTGDEGNETVLASWPVDARGVVTISRDSVVGLEPATHMAMTGCSGAWQPVRRRRNDLTDPRVAATLPQIDHPDADRPLLRLPWSRDALLLVRLFDYGDPGEPGKAS